MAFDNDNKSAVGTYMKKNGFMNESLYHVLRSVGAANDGEWIDMRGAVYANLDVAGMVTNDIVQIRGSNEPTIPDDTAHERQVGSDITADGYTTLEAKEIPRWLKVRKSDNSGGGTAIAYLKVMRHSS